jgi:hypothetical protein
MYITALPKAFSLILIASAGTYQTGNDLLNNCVGNATENVACLGYIQGVADMWSVFRAANNHGECIPDGVVTRQLHDVVVRYLQDHPEHRHENGAGMVIEAFAKTWGCK